MKFTLEINLGDAMQTCTDIADALKATARKLVGCGPTLDGDGGEIRDLNGNTVGQWDINGETI